MLLLITLGFACSHSPSPQPTPDPGAMPSDRWQLPIKPGPRGGEVSKQQCPPCPCQRVWMISPWALKLTGMPLPIMIEPGYFDDSTNFFTDQEMAEFYGLTLEQFKEKFLGEQPAHKKKGAM